MRDSLQPDRLRVSASSCHDRYCLPCGNLRGRIVAANLANRIKDQPHRLITLTLKSDDEPLLTLIRRLYKGFSALRRRKNWRSRMAGGAAVVEVKWNAGRKRWHPHLHIIAEGKYYPKDELSADWLSVTGDSYIVDIRLIRGHRETVHYVTKYVGKPLDQTVIHDHDRLCELIGALHGRHLCLTFGSWSGVKLTAIHDDTDWVPLAPLADIILSARRGDAEAEQIMRLLRPREYDLPDQPAEPNLWNQ